MKLERLLALIRLANNNPNENEANLAARTVCKVLGANQNFMRTGILEIRTTQAKVGVSTPDRKNTAIWNDVRRSTEPAWGNRPTNPGGFNPRFYGPGFERMWEYFNNIPRKDAPEPDYEPRKQWNANPFKTGEQKTKSSEFHYDPNTGKRIYKEEMRKCNKCGLEIMTRRIHESPWVCNPCHWKEVP